MAIVTIFAGTLGDDEEVARNVATQLGYAFIGRELLSAASRRCEVPEAKLNDIVEKEPRWWEGWQENLRPYRIALQAAMSEAALGGNLVYCGHVGHGLLPGIRHVLRALLTAPMDYRVEQVHELQGLEAKAARRYIARVDKAHTRRMMALFGTDWRDTGQYALVLNRAQLSAFGAQKLIAAAAQLIDYQTTDASRQALEDLALSSKIESHLLTYPRLRDLNINVQASEGEVTLSGVIPSAVSESEIRRALETIPEIKKLTTDFVMIPPSVAHWT
jgi:cytidylate kinase